MLSKILLATNLLICAGPAISQSIDLSQWSRHPIELKEDFFVLPNVQQPEEFQSMAKDSLGTAPVNTHFTKLQLNSRMMKAQDNASFAILLKNLPAGEYGFRIRVDSSVEAFLIPQTGRIQKIVAMGKPGRSKESTTPEIGDRLGRFETDKQSNAWLLINVANYHFKEGMVWKRPTIGAYDKMLSEWRLQGFGDAILLGIIGILTAYNIALYFHQREERSYLWLSGYCFFMLVRLIATHAPNISILFHRQTPALYSTLRVMEFAFVPISCAFFLNFVVGNFGNKKYWRSFQKKYMFGSIAYTLIVIFIDTKYLPDLLPIIAFYTLSTIIIGTGIIAKAIKYQKLGSTIMLVGSLPFLGSVVYDVLCGLAIIDSPIYISSFGFAIFIFFHGQIIARLFATTFRRVQVLSHHLKEEVEKQTSEIKGMLDNIPLGICSVDGSGSILKNHSTMLPEIIGVENPTGKNFLETVFGSSNLSTDARAILKEALSSCFDESIIAYEVNSAHFPSDIKCRVQGSDRFLQCIWTPLVGRNAQVERIMLVLRDITSLRQAESLQAEHQREMDFIIELVNVTADSFRSFTDMSHPFIVQSIQLVSDGKAEEPEGLKIIMANLHTIKGASRTLRFQRLTTLVHDVEQIVSNSVQNSGILDASDLLSKLFEIQNMLIYLEYLHYEKMGRQREEEGKIQLPRKALEDHIRILQKIPPDSIGSSILNEMKLGLDQLEFACFQSADDTFRKVFESARKVARDLGKPDPIADFECDKILFTQEGADLISKIFVHIVRNSMDHGIEFKEERLQSGKSEEGHISIRIHAHSDKLLLEYWDDGRGLNIEKLKSRASTEHLIEPSELEDRYKLAHLIFISGFSTSSGVTEISGRGVGMDAVKRFVEEKGGHVELKLREYNSTSFVKFTILITLPSTLYLTKEASAFV